MKACSARTPNNFSRTLATTISANHLQKKYLRRHIEKNSCEGISKLFGALILHSFFSASSSARLGTITWVYCQRSFWWGNRHHCRSRSKIIFAVVITSIFVRIIFAVIAIVFLLLRHSCSHGVSLFFLAGSTLVVWVFYFFYLPETKVWKTWRETLFS